MRVVVSCGDVNGIGLRCFEDVCATHTINATLTLAIDTSTLQEAITAYSLRGTLSNNTWHCGPNAITILAVHAPCRVHPGTVQSDSARCAIASLNVATNAVLNKQVDALVTLPINKHAMSTQGWPYMGQTEMLAQHAGGASLMVLCSESTRVALATVHSALRDVDALLTTTLLCNRIEQLHHHLTFDLGLQHPRIAVLAVDPHAGEHGVIGTTDQAVVAPAVALCAANGMLVAGPFPADGFFGFGAYKKFDGILAMYHDQGLIPLKLMAQGAGVNCTAGLSIVRTSPDHGTAYDKAANGNVDSRSTFEAIQLAMSIATTRAGATKGR